MYSLNKVSQLDFDDRLSKEDKVDEQEILEKIKAVVADKLDTDPTDITETASFVDDLGADSLDVVELIMGLEDEFGIEISDEEAENLRTVGDAVKFVASQ
jgi:acyl carrier protein